HTSSKRDWSSDVCSSDLPVGIPGLHESRMPFQLVAAFDELIAQLGVAATIAQVPLTRGNNFQGLVTFFKEVHRVHDLLRFAIERSEERRVGKGDGCGGGA